MENSYIEFNFWNKRSLFFCQCKEHEFNWNCYFTLINKARIKLSKMKENIRISFSYALERRMWMLLNNVQLTHAPKIKVPNFPSQKLHNNFLFFILLHNSILFLFAVASNTSVASATSLAFQSQLAKSKITQRIRHQKNLGLNCFNMHIKRALLVESFLQLLSAKPFIVHVFFLLSDVWETEIRQ